MQMMKGKLLISFAAKCPRQARLLKPLKHNLKKKREEKKKKEKEKTVDKK